MKIKNENINIRIGNKNFNFNNLILDTYLNRFVKGQLDETKINTFSYKKDLRACLIKFDNAFSNVNESSVIYNNMFDIAATMEMHSQVINDNQIVVEYSYDMKRVYDYKEGTLKDISNYNGRKIAAIAFNVSLTYASTGSFDLPILSFLDASNYNIYLQENQDLSITRKDIITTDALFYTDDKNVVPGPAHLGPYGVPQIIFQPDIYNSDGTSWSHFYDEAYGILYSVGLSSYINNIDKEFIVGQDIQVEENGSELIIDQIENYLIADNSLFCNENLYPNSNLYPIKSNYKYVIFKYKLWQTVSSGTYENIVRTITDTKYFYHQAIPIEKFGKTNLKILYERG